MRKKDNNLTPAEKERIDEGMRRVIRDNFKEFDRLGGVAVIISDNKPGDKEETITQFFTSRIPDLHIKSRIMERNLDVEVSSVEEENQSLLHFLFKKTVRK